MIGLGTLANTGAIVLGGLLGLLFGKRLTERYQKTIVSGMAMCVMFVGVAGTLQEMLRADADGRLVSHGGREAVPIFRSDATDFFVTLPNLNYGDPVASGNKKVTRKVIRK